MSEVLLHNGLGPHSLEEKKREGDKKLHGPKRRFFFSSLGLSAAFFLLIPISWIRFPKRESGFPNFFIPNGELEEMELENE